MTSVARTPVAITPVARTPVARTPVARTPVARTPVAYVIYGGGCGRINPYLLLAFTNIHWAEGADTTTTLRQRALHSNFFIPSFF